MQSDNYNVLLDDAIAMRRKFDLIKDALVNLTEAIERVQEWGADTRVGQALSDAEVALLKAAQ